MSARSFLGTQKLYGESAFEVFAHAHAYVVGVGGVGTWLAEALARTGIGTLTLIDMDIVVQSNINRQLAALNSTLGLGKIAVMGERIAQINPACTVHLVDEFLDTDNVATLLPHRPAKHTLVFDCTDDSRAKLAMALHCRFHRLNLVVAGGAGGKTDPTTLTTTDLKDAYQDPLLARLRQNLKKSGIKDKKYGIRCVYATQALQNRGTAKLGCQGYGSSVVMTCAMAMMMAGEGLRQLAQKQSLDNLTPQP